MRIGRVQPNPPPPDFTMKFSRHEGWAVKAALQEYADKHLHAEDRDKWREWARMLDIELRR